VDDEGEGDYMDMGEDDYWNEREEEEEEEEEGGAAGKPKSKKKNGSSCHRCLHMHLKDPLLSSNE
jgi:hypothetical protein